MARDPFAEMSPELSGAGKRGKLNVGRIVVGLVVIASATFLFAFYVPLSSAHSELLTEHETLRKSNSGTNEQLDKTTQQLMEAQRERDELKSKLDALEAEKAAARKPMDTLGSALEGKLDKGASLEELPSGYEVVIDNLTLFRGHETSVHPPGRKYLCKVGKVIGAVDAEVLVQVFSASAQVTNPILRREHSNVWDVSAARAVSALQVLEACGVPGARLRAVGRAQHGVGKLPAKSDGQVRLLLVPGKA